MAAPIRQDKARAQPASAKFTIKPCIVKFSSGKVFKGKRLRITEATPSVERIAKETCIIPKIVSPAEVLSHTHNEIRFRITTKKVAASVVAPNWPKNKLAIESNNYKNLSLVSVEVTVKPFQNLKTTVLNINSKNVNLDKNKIEKLLGKLSNLVRNPKEVCKLLKPLDELVAKKMAEQSIGLSDKATPKFMISGKGHFVLGPPQSWEAIDIKRGRLLDTILLGIEQQQGINSEGTPIFIGHITRQAADDFLSKGHLFKEDVDVTRFLLHGKNTHRLMFQVLIESLKTDPDFQEITPKDFLSILANVKIVQDVSGDFLYCNAWELLMDTLNDTLAAVSNAEAIDELIEVTKYNYSCRSPFVFNSILLCFGDHLGLPHLTQMLRISHWKSSKKMLAELRNNSDQNPVDQDAGYTLIMEALTASKGRINDVSQRLAFSMSWERAALKEQYAIYPDARYLAIKKKIRKEEISLESIKKEFMAQLNDQGVLDLCIEASLHPEWILEYLQNAEFPILYDALYQQGNPVLHDGLLDILLRRELSEDQIYMLKKLAIEEQDTYLASEMQRRGA